MPIQKNWEQSFKTVPILNIKYNYSKRQNNMNVQCAVCNVQCATALSFEKILMSLTILLF